MRKLSLLAAGLCILWAGVQAAETSVESALEKARQRAGASPSTNAPQDASQRAAAEAAARRAKAEADAQKAKEQVARQKAEEAKKESEAPAAPRPAPAEEPQAPKVIRIFVLEDRTEIQAVLVIETDDGYTVKDVNGKLRSLARKDVIEMKEPPAEAGK
jgi:sRNA-binding protein